MIWFKKAFAVLLLVATIRLLVSEAHAQPITSTMFVESGFHCSEGQINEAVDVKLFVNAGPNGVSVWRCVLDYFPSMWHVVGVDMGPAMVAAYGALIVNLNLPPEVPPINGGDNFLILGLPSVSHTMYGQNLHIATIHMVRNNYPEPVGPTPLSFGPIGTDWSDNLGNELFGYGLPNTQLLNGCWKLKDANCSPLENCPVGSYTPCPKCPPELDKVGRPVRTPHAEGWTDVTPSPWASIKQMYR